jgi:cytochrome c peroxidase
VKNIIRSQKNVVLCLIAIGGLAIATAPIISAIEAKPKYTTKEVMKALHKGDINVAKRVLKGQGTKADFAKLVEYYQSLPLNAPPRGDKASWDAKTVALLSAAKSLNAGDPNGLNAFKQAVNCKACHSVHKPE